MFGISVPAGRTVPKQVDKHFGSGFEDQELDLRERWHAYVGTLLCIEVTDCHELKSFLSALAHGIAE